jgi:hypothetical protein
MNVDVATISNNTSGSRMKSNEPPAAQLQSGLSKEQLQMCWEWFFELIKQTTLQILSKIIAFKKRVEENQSNEIISVDTWVNLVKVFGIYKIPKSATSSENTNLISKFYSELQNPQKNGNILGQFENAKKTLTLDFIEYIVELLRPIDMSLKSS